MRGLKLPFPRILSGTATVELYSVTYLMYVHFIDTSDLALLTTTRHVPSLVMCWPCLTFHLMLSFWPSFRLEEEDEDDDEDVDDDDVDVDDDETEGDFACTD